MPELESHRVVPFTVSHRWSSISESPRTSNMRTARNEIEDESSSLDDNSSSDSSNDESVALLNRHHVERTPSRTNKSFSRETSPEPATLAQPSDDISMHRSGQHRCPNNDKDKQKVLLSTEDDGARNPRALDAKRSAQTQLQGPDLMHFHQGQYPSGALSSLRGQGLSHLGMLHSSQHFKMSNARNPTDQGMTGRAPPTARGNSTLDSAKLEYPWTPSRDESLLSDHIAKLTAASNHYRLQLQQLQSARLEALAALRGNEKGPGEVACDTGGPAPSPRSSQLGDPSCVDATQSTLGQASPLFDHEGFPTRLPEHHPLSCNTTRAMRDSYQIQAALLRSRPQAQVGGMGTLGGGNADSRIALLRAQLAGNLPLFDPTLRQQREELLRTSLRRQHVSTDILEPESTQNAIPSKNGNLTRANKAAANSESGDASFKASSAPASAFLTSASNSNEPRCVRLHGESDKLSLTPYQCLLRRQLEIFEASSAEKNETAQGRNRPIVEGQVGIRCIHCGRLPYQQRAKGAVYYPSTLASMYQVAQNMANSHLLKHCEKIPKSIREDLVKIRMKEAGEAHNTTRKSSFGGGRAYWASGLRALGVVETEERRLRFEDYESSK